MTEFVRPIQERIEDFLILDIEALCNHADHLKYHIPDSLSESELHAALDSIIEESAHSLVVREALGGGEQIVLHGRDYSHGNLRGEVLGRAKRQSRAAHLVLSESQVLLALLEYDFQRPTSGVNPVGLEEIELAIGGNPNMIDIRLKVFQSVARNLSFTKASQELFISQPAISKHVQELEKEYNVRLFERLGNKIQLTKAGQLLLDHANKILKNYQKLNYDMNALQQYTTGELRIGASTTISQYVVPEMIAAFHRQFPDVRISMLSGNSREIEYALSSDRIDIGMVEGVIRQPQLKYTSFMDDELVAIVRSDNTQLTKESISLAELKSIPIVIREFGSGTLDVIQQALKRQGISLSDLDIEMNFGTTEGIKHYVEKSDALGIVSIRSVNKEIYSNIFRIVEIDGMSINRKLSLVEKQGETSEIAKSFKRFITAGYKG